tara:strand:- start:475 stop:675 length:201 start_codon:yes stop_codon:yes gene_type:complete
MKELQDIINDLQARLAIVGGGRIIITSDHVSISLGEEHENFEVQEKSSCDSPINPDVEMFTQMWGQ